MGYIVSPISKKKAQELVAKSDKALLNRYLKSKKVSHINIARRIGRGYQPHLVVVFKNGDYVELGIAKKKYKEAIELLEGSKRKHRRKRRR